MVYTMPGYLVKSSGYKEGKADPINEKVPLLAQSKISMHTGKTL